MLGKKGAMGIVTINVVVLFILAGIVTISPVWIKHNKYTSTHECFVSGITTSPATGEVYLLKMEDGKTVKIQASQCVNMEDIEVGDNMLIVSVTDKDGYVLCYVKVDEYENIYK